MPNLSFYNWVDVTILVLFGLGLLVGYSQGLLRQVISLAAIYLAMILATQYYVSLSYVIAGLLFVTPTRFLSVTAFLILLFGVSSTINFLAVDAYRLTKLQLSSVIDQVGGALLGLVIVILIIILLLPILQFLLIEPLPYIDNVRNLAVEGIRTSRLAAFFLNYRSNLVEAISPWLPGGHVPLIFH